MTGIAPFDAELPYALSVDQAANHLTTTATLTKLPPDRGLYSGEALVLVADPENQDAGEIISVSAFAAHYLTVDDTGRFNTPARTHAAGEHVYEIVSLRFTDSGLLVGFVGDSDTLEYVRLTVGTSTPTQLPQEQGPNTVLIVNEDGDLVFDSLVLNFDGENLPPADLTNSTTGVASVTSPPTLIAMRVDTIAHLMADSAANFATLLAYCEAVNDALTNVQVVPND